MSHEKLKWMKDSLICVVESQLCNLEEVDTKELGEAIDMIKDLEEAIYYCTVTEAMNHPEKEIEWGMKKDGHHQENGDSRMYYSNPRYMYADDGRRRRADGTFYMDNSSSGQNYNMDSNDMSYAMMDMNGRSYNDSGMGYRDSREGRSYNSRRMYMEAKDMKKDKAIQLRELEKYMSELSQDITDMIMDSSPEEKQYLEKKISALATKIGNMK